MQRLNLLNLDLNLLVALDALVQEESVSRAASRIGMTQPAMSRTLRQLHELFGDELLRRTSDGMKPTPRAVTLAQAIRPNLENIAAAIGQRLSFDPATASRRFVLALPDLAARLALPRVVKQISAQAPGIELAIITTVNHDALHKLETGQAELALGVYDHLPRSYAQATAARCAKSAWRIRPIPCCRMAFSTWKPSLHCRMSPSPWRIMKERP